MTTSTWTNPVSGDWSDAADWTGGEPDSSTAVATIAEPGTYTVTIGNETVSVETATLDDAGATLQINGTLDLAGTLNLTAGTLDLAGTINGGMVAAAAGANTTFANGTLNGVTWHGAINLATSSATVFIANGLTMSGAGGAGTGTIAMTGTNSALAFTTSGTLNGATVNFGPLGGSNAVGDVSGYISFDASGVTVTFGSSLVINADTNFTGDDLGGNWNYSGSIINDGTINAGAAVSSAFYITSQVASFTNNGAITASNGDTLVIRSGSFTNNGTVTANSGGVVDYQINLTTAQLAGVTASGGGAVQIDSGETLNNTGATLNIGIGQAIGLFDLAGTIKGGTIVDAGSGLNPIRATDVTGTLDGVTYQGTLSLPTAGQTLNLVDGFTGVAGKTSINVTGSGGALFFANSETIDDATITIGASGSNAVGDASASIILNTAGETVTFGPNLVIDAGTSAAQSFSEVFIQTNGASASLINNGVIAATANYNSLFRITSGIASFTNDGTIIVSKGDDFQIQSADFTNLTGTTLTGGFYDVDAAGAGDDSGNVSTLELGSNAQIDTDDADITLNGAASVIEALNTTTNKEVTIDQTLTTIAAKGELDLFAGANFTASGPFTNAGVLQLGLGGGDFTASGLNDETGSLLIGNGKVTAAITNNGTIIAEAPNGTAILGSTLDLEGTVSGTGGFTIDASATMFFDDPVTDTANIAFSGAGATLELSNKAVASGFANALSGLAAGDTIDLSGFTSGGATLTWTQNAGQGVLEVRDGANSVGITILGTFSQSQFAAVAEGTGGTEIEVSALPPGKYIDNGAYATTGYTLDGKYSSVTIGPAGVIGGPGLLGGTKEAYAVINGNTITGFYNGVLLQDGGTITNSAAKSLIEGIYAGVAVDGGPGTVANTGAIKATGAYGVGVNLTAGGSVTNSGAAAQITGAFEGVAIEGAAGTVANTGLILAPTSGTTGIGVYLGAGGYVGNTATNALIGGFYGVKIEGAAGTVSNLGAIATNGTTGAAVYLGYGGVVSNSTSNALVAGLIGVEVEVAPGTVANAGTIKGNSINKSGYGVVLEDGGAVTNSAGALIEGYGGVEVNGAAGTVANAGTIKAANALLTVGGIDLTVGGAVTNDAGGLIEGYVGVDMSGAAGSIINSGTINGHGGVALKAGGVVTNEASGLIEGALYAVYFNNIASTIINSGTINGQLRMYDGGFLTNYAGGLIDHTPGIKILGLAGGVSNAGTISGDSKYGVYLGAGGTVTNSAGALIAAYSGIEILGDAGTVTNAGTIEATTDSFGTAFTGIYLEAGGSVINSAGGLIEGHTGVEFEKIAAVLVNAGAIEATGSGAIGAYLIAGGAVTNMSGGFIEGLAGVEVKKIAATVVNAGTIEATGTGSTSSGGVYLSAGGVVSNGVGALIEGYDGVAARTVAATVSNAGTIMSLGHGAQAHGVALAAGGAVTNQAGGLISGNDGIQISGSTGHVVNAGTINGNGYDGVTLVAGGVVTNNAGGLIEGYCGVRLSGAADTAINAGTINATGTSGALAVGAYLSARGAVSNSASGLIEGLIGVEVKGTSGVFGVVTNAGTIASTAGASGTAVRFASNQDVLIDDPAAQFVGKVVGAGGTLELAGSVGGTLGGLGSTFTGFGTVDVLAGASWTFTGANTAAAGVTFDDAGSLVDSGVLELDGATTIAGAISGAGTLRLGGGTVRLDAAANLTVAHWSVANSAVTFAAGLSFGGAFTENAGVFALGGHNVSLTGSVGFTGGAVSGAGLLTTHAAVSLAGLLLDAGAVWLDDGTVTETALLTLGNSGGSGRLDIAAGGIFDITQNVGAAVATGGTGAIGNAGLFEKTAGTGKSSIAAALNNTGTIAATVGTLDLQGAVTGAGAATIGVKGTLEVDAAVAATQTISFAGTTGGELVLNDPSGTALAFAGLISDFNGSEKLDLATFAFSGKPKIAWTQNGAQGLLTVTDGADTAQIALLGQYVAADFKTATDGAAGTLVTYTGPSPGEAAPLAPHN